MTGAHGDGQPARAVRPRRSDAGSAWRDGAARDGARQSGTALRGPDVLRYGGWRELPGGTFLMGCDDGPYPADGEGPVREVTLAAFRLAATAVTNAEFAAFAAATGHRSDAERFGWSFVFGGFLPDDFPPTRAAARTLVAAGLRRGLAAPGGSGLGPRGRGDHPVVHVSHNDALAYCALGRYAAADGGRVGVRGPRRAGGAAVPVG